MVAEQLKQEIKLIAGVLKDTKTVNADKTLHDRKYNTCIKPQIYLIKCNNFSSLHIVNSKKRRMAVSISRYLQIKQYSTCMGVGLFP